jgi:hypothetical protein
MSVQTRGTLGRECSDSGLSHGHSQSRRRTEAKAKQRYQPGGASLGVNDEFVYVTTSQSCAGRDLVNSPKGMD